MRKILHLGLNHGHYFPQDIVIHRPILSTQKVEIAENLIREIKNFSTVVITSKEAVKHFLIPYGSYLNQDVKILSIGDQTTQSIQKAGFLVSHQAKHPTQEGIIDLINHKKGIGDSFLLIKSNLSRDKLDLFFKNNKISFLPLIAYETYINKNFEKMELKGLDAIFFSSPSCVKFFFSVYQEIPSHLQIIVMGPITNNYLKNYNDIFNNVQLIIGE